MSDSQGVEVRVTQADREAAAKALGYRDADDATDYRLTGNQDREYEAMVKAFAEHRLAANPSSSNPQTTQRSTTNG